VSRPAISGWHPIEGAGLPANGSTFHTCRCRPLNPLRVPDEKIERAAFSVENVNHSWLGVVGLAGAVGIAYFPAAWLGLALRAQVGLAIFWPAAGIATGVLIALGPATRLPVTIGVAVASMASSLLIGRSPWLAITFVFLNVGQVLLAACLV